MEPPDASGKKIRRLKMTQRRASWRPLLTFQIIILMGGKPERGRLVAEYGKCLQDAVGRAGRSTVERSPKGAMNEPEGCLGWQRNGQLKGQGQRLRKIDVYQVKKYTFYLT